MKQYKQNPIEDFDGFSMPDSHDVECQVLADLINSPEYIPTAKGIVNSGMFSYEAFRQVWDTINTKSEKGETIDLVTIGTHIDRQTIIEIVNPKFGTYCTDLSIVAHCGALVEMATRRLVFSSAYEMLRMSTYNGTDFNDLIARPGQLIEAITSTTGTGASTQSLSNVLNDLAETIEANQVNEAKGKRTRVPTGFQMLDRLTYNGFNAGNLVILSARPSVGKTAIMLQMAMSASRGGFPATIYSLEMTNQELAQRMLFSTGMVTPGQIAKNNIDWSAFETANGRLCGMPLYLNDTARTLEEICNNITMAHQQGRCNIAFIDYLGLIQSTNPRQSIYQAVTERTARLKRVAKECKIPIVLLCQLNRNTESENRSPDLYDLRDSGSIEQDADIVLMLERANRDLSNHDVNMWVRKNRQGMAGNICIELRGNDTFTEFVER